MVAASIRCGAESVPLLVGSASDDNQTQARFVRKQNQTKKNQTKRKRRHVCTAGSKLGQWIALFRPQRRQFFLEVPVERGKHKGKSGGVDQNHVIRASTGGLRPVVDVLGKSG